MTTNALKRPLAIFTVLGGLLIAATPASAADHGAGPDGSSSRGDAANFKAVIVLIGANDYGFAEIDPSQ